MAKDVIITQQYVCQIHSQRHIKVRALENGYLEAIPVKEGQEVKKGERIGLAGHTGRATGPHLFFAIRWHNARVDPQYFLVDVDKIPGPGGPS